MDRRRHDARRGERGFNLIEVIVAIGVLAGVLVSISSMFMLGGRQVKVGKTMTEATTLVHAIMETFDTQSYTSLWTGLGAVSTDTTKTVYSNSGTTTLTAFQPEIGRKLADGFATLLLTPLGGPSSPPQFGNCVAIRMTVTVTWSELGQTRSVTAATIRF